MLFDMAIMKQVEENKFPIQLNQQINPYWNEFDSVQYKNLWSNHQISEQSNNKKNGTSLFN